MSEIEKLPTSFQDTLMSIYGGEHVTGRNHTVDQIRYVAESCIAMSNFSVVKKVGFLTREVEQKSPVAFEGTIGEEDVLYGLAVRSTGRYTTSSYLPFTNYRLGSDSVSTLPIHLTINQDWNRPAAIITPAKDSDTPAALVVGNNVNVPEQIDEIRDLLRDGGRNYVTNMFSQDKNYIDHMLTTTFSDRSIDS